MLMPRGEWGKQDAGSFGGQNIRCDTIAVGCGYLCHISAALFYSILFCPFCAALLYKHVCFTATEAGSGESWSSDAVPFVVLADWFVRLPTGVTTCRTRTRSSADSTRSFLLFRQFSILSSLGGTVAEARRAVMECSGR